MEITYQQHSSAISKIEYINSTPSDSGYLARVIFPDGLITNNKNLLQYCNVLFAQADIITMDMRLIEWVYYFNLNFKQLASCYMCKDARLHTLGLSF